MTNILVYQLEPYYTDDDMDLPTLDQELVLLDYIFTESAHIDRSMYCKEHIELDDAAELVAATPRALEYWREQISDDILTDFVIDKPEKLAHHLATSEPLLATQLLDELLYWRSIGRI